MASKKKPAKDAAASAPKVAPIKPKPAAVKPAPPAPKPPVPKPPAKASPKTPAKKAPAAPAAAPATPPAAVEAPKPAAKPRASSKKAAAAPPTKAGPAKPAPVAPIKRPPKPIAAALDDIEGPDDDDLEEDDDGAGPGAEEEVEAELPVPSALASEGGAPPMPRPKKVAPLVLPPMPARKPGVIRVAFSPDADDAFMLYGLQHEKVDTQGRRYELIRADIAALNEESKKGTYDVTAFSFGAWPHVSERYTVLPCGGSFGDHVGPVLVSKTAVRSSEVDGLTVGVPGLSTTAALVLRLWQPRARLKLVPVPFDKITAAVKGGLVRAGLLIHEGQLTWKTDGLWRVVDLGQWWGERTEGLPLPLGGTAIRRDIGPEERAGVALDLKRSIAYAMGHREEALAYAAQFARGLAKDLLDKYVSLYVNELTLDFGERGKQAVQTLYDEAHRAGILSEHTELDFA